ncbi:MAG: TlpA disulfide reductase family protein [Burkholderiales bacterium]|jgi:thiol-disulfide isomerase/thioredoxin
MAHAPSFRRPRELGPAPDDGRRGLLHRAATIGAVAGFGGFVWWRVTDLPGPKRLPSIGYPLIDGRRLETVSLLGGPVLVNFWATSCAPCVAEMPELAEVYRAYRPRGLELIAVAMPYDRPDHVLQFASSRALPFPVALDPTGDAVRAWGGIEGTPSTWLAGPTGRIERFWLGTPDFTDLRRTVERLLTARPA